MSAQRAREAKELITDLGPAFVKIVQDRGSDQKDDPDVIPGYWMIPWMCIFERTGNRCAILCNGDKIL